MSYDKDQAAAEFTRWSESYDRSVLQWMLFGPSHRVLIRRITAVAGKSAVPAPRRWVWNGPFCRATQSRAASGPGLRSGPRVRDALEGSSPLEVPCPRCLACPGRQ